MRYALAFILLFAASAAAESTLLLEMRQSSSFWSTGGNAHLGFLTSDVSTPGYYGELVGTYREADVGRVIHPNGENLQRLSQHLEGGVGKFMVRTFDTEALLGWFPMDIIWTPEQFPQMFGVTTTIDTFVPRVGYGLYGYRITDVTDTLDHIDFTPLSQYRIPGEATHTIRVYGEALPHYTYPPLAGDYNENGTVDAADYIVWRKLMMQTEGTRPDLPNAIAGPRPAMEADYGAWRYYFGESVPPIEAASVPEPATWLLASLALCFVRTTAPDDLRMRYRHRLARPTTPESTNTEAWPASLFERNCPSK